MDRTSKALHRPAELDQFDDVWYYIDHTGQVGPFTLEELKFELSAIQNAKSLYVWCDGMADWQPVATIPELNRQVKSPPPPRINPPIDFGLKYRQTIRGVIGLVSLLAIGVYFSDSSAGLKQNEIKAKVARNAREQEFVSLAPGADALIPAAQPLPVPGEEQKFCTIIQNAKPVYQGLYEQRKIAREQKNGIVEDRISKEMTSVHHNRNKDSFGLLQRTGFTFENWEVAIERIDSPDSTLDKILNLPGLGIDVKLSCSMVATIHARVLADVNTIKILSQKKKGDYIIISGKFVRREFDGKANRPASADKLELSLTEYGSVDRPEYGADITSIKEAVIP